MSNPFLIARKYLEKEQHALQAIDTVVDDRTIAVLIDSSLLGAPIWFALREGWRPQEAEGIAIFYASELPALRHKTPAELRSIFNVKSAFGGGIVRQ